MKTFLAIFIPLVAPFAAFIAWDTSERTCREEVHTSFSGRFAVYEICTGASGIDGKMEFKRFVTRYVEVDTGMEF